MRNPDSDLSPSCPAASAFSHSTSPVPYGGGACGHLKAFSPFLPVVSSSTRTADCYVRREGQARAFFPSTAPSNCSPLWKSTWSLSSALSSTHNPSIHNDENCTNCPSPLDHPWSLITHASWSLRKADTAGFYQSGRPALSPFSQLFAIKKLTAQSKIWGPTT